jgi:hypothetical protein
MAHNIMETFDFQPDAALAIGYQPVMPVLPLLMAVKTVLLSEFEFSRKRKPTLNYAFGFILADVAPNFYPA